MMTLTARRRGDESPSTAHKSNNELPADANSKYSKTNLGVSRFICLFVVAVVSCLYYSTTTTTLGPAGLLLPPTQQQQQQQQQTNLCEPVEQWDAKVRAIKAKVDIFETDPTAQDAARQLQTATRALLAHVYGPREPYRVVVDLTFPTVVPDYQAKGSQGRFVIDMGPSALIPHSVYTFLELARQFQGGAFHRIAPHVLQVRMSKIKDDPASNPHPYPHTIEHLAFQEYNPAFPHRKGTVGYAGRPSGPAWYTSIQDNTRNHGPGSQQQHNPHEADALFGTIVEGFEETVLRIATVPGKGFLSNSDHHVVINSLTILVPADDDVSSSAEKVYTEWQPPSDMCLGVPVPPATPVAA